MYRVKYLKALTIPTVAIALLSSPQVTASEPEVMQSTSEKMLRVKLNQITLVTLKEPIKDALIGNPSIADITLKSRKSFVITGKSYGHTNILMLNNKGETIFNKAVSVDDDRENIVRVQHGASRLSYTCSPNCQPTPTLGDDPKYVKNVNNNLKDKIKMIGEAIATSEN